MAHGRRDWIACVLIVTAACALSTAVGLAQGVTGAVIGTVRDADGGVISGATARLESPALISGPQSVTTNEKGQLRFANLPPGIYSLEIAMAGFATYRDEHIDVGAGATIERTVRLNLAGFAESIVVEGAGTRIEARNAGFGTRFGTNEIRRMPTRRSSMFDFIRSAPGIFLSLLKSRSGMP